MKKPVPQVLPASSWEKLILRWSELPTVPEARLVAAAMALWIHEEQQRAIRGKYEPSYSGVLGRALESACIALGIDYEYLLDCLSRSWTNRGEIGKQASLKAA